MSAEQDQLIKTLREECRVKDGIIQDLRNSIASPTMTTNQPENETPTHIPYCNTCGKMHSGSCATPPPEKPGEGQATTVCEYCKGSGRFVGGPGDGEECPFCKQANATLTCEQLLKLTNGHEPHRVDGWTSGMLPVGWRPLLTGEPPKEGDERFSDMDQWEPVSTLQTLPTGPTMMHMRTSRPAPAAQAPGEQSVALANNPDRLLAKQSDAITRLQSDNDSLRAEIERLKGDSDTRSRRMLEASLQQSQEQVASLTRERNETKRHLATPRSRAESAEARVKVLEGELGKYPSLTQAVMDSKTARITELESELTTLRDRNRWQPIETAPKDGTDFWAVRKFGDGWRHFECRYVITTAGPKWHDLSANEWGKPTHWQPLPEPPLPTSQAESEETITTPLTANPMTWTPLSLRKPEASDANADGMVLFRSRTVVDGRDLWDISEAPWHEHDGAEYWLSIPAFWTELDKEEAQSEEVMRKEFEEMVKTWGSAERDLTRNTTDNSYVYSHIQTGWLTWQTAWQASRKGAQDHETK